MKFNSSNIQLTKRTSGYFLNIEVPNSQLDELQKLINKDVVKTVEIKQHREKRSLDANAYAFKLMSEIAKKLTSTTEEVYEQMLQRYGVHDYCVVIIEALPTLKKVFKFIDVHNKVKVNGKDAVQVKCTLGSSNYDSLQMSQFIEGIKTECDILKISTLTPEEVKRLLNNWEGK